MARTKTRTSKTKYLTYIEDTPKHHDLLNKIAKKSGEKAIERSESQDVPVTFLDGKRIVRKSSNGEKIVLTEFSITQRKVKVGSKSRIQKR